MHDRLKVMACQVMDVHRLRGHMSTFISAAISHCQAAICGGRRTRIAVDLSTYSALVDESGSYYEHKEAEVGHTAEKVWPL